MSMPTDGGRDLTLTRNPSTGQFSLFTWDATGNPAFDDSDAHTVVSCLLEDEGGYWSDPTGERGSVLHLIKLDVTGTASQLQTAASKALDYAVKNQLIQSATVTAERKGPARFDMMVSYKNRRGHQENKRVPVGG